MLEWLRRHGIDPQHLDDATLLLPLEGPTAPLLRWSFAAEGIGAAHPDHAEAMIVDRSLDPARIERALRRALGPELICFDVDGTLIDNSPSLLATFQATLQILTGRAFSAAEIVAARQAQAWSGDEAFVAALCRRCGCAVSTDEVERLIDALYFPSADHPGFCRLERVMLRPDLLQRLIGRFALAIVTGRSRRRMDPIRTLLGLPDSVTVICRDDVVADKPDPEGIRRVLSAARCRHAWMLGDRAADIVAATRAGVLPIGVGPARAELEAAGAALVLHDVNDLDALLAAISLPSSG